MTLHPELDLYERLAGATRRMAESARCGDWEAVLAAERDCSSLVTLAREQGPTALDGPGRARKTALLLAMIADDAEVRALVFPELGRLEALLGAGRRAARASEAYGGSPG